MILPSRKEVIANSVMHYLLCVAISFAWILNWFFFDGDFALGVLTNTTHEVAIIGSFLALFSHLSWDHYLSNILFLIVVAPILVRILKPFEYIMISIVGTIIIGLLTFSLDVRDLVNHVGSSGLVWCYLTVTVGYGYYVLRRGFMLDMFSLLLYTLNVMMMVSIFSGLFPQSTSVTISWQMHIGGFIAGLIGCIWLISRTKQLEYKDLHMPITPEHFIRVTSFDGVCWDGREIVAYRESSEEPFVSLEYKPSSFTRAMFNKLAVYSEHLKPYTYGKVPKSAINPDNSK